MTFPKNRRIEETSVETALRLIKNAEFDLKRSLSHGERRDLLKDNTPWTPVTVATIVNIIRTRGY